MRASRRKVTLHSHIVYQGLKPRHTKGKAPAEGNVWMAPPLTYSVRPQPFAWIVNLRNGGRRARVIYDLRGWCTMFGVYAAQLPWDHQRTNTMGAYRRPEASQCGHWLPRGLTSGPAQALRYNHGMPSVRPMRALQQLHHRAATRDAHEREFSVLEDSLIRARANMVISEQVLTHVSSQSWATDRTRPSKPKWLTGPSRGLLRRY